MVGILVHGNNHSYRPDRYLTRQPRWRWCGTGPSSKLARRSRRHSGSGRNCTTPGEVSRSPRTMTAHSRFSRNSFDLISVVSISVLTGLRIGEILALRWKRIDLLGATLEVAETYSSGEFGPPKTKSSRRVIPISSALRRVLEDQRAGTNPEDLVFQTPKGTPLSDKNLYNRELAPACDQIGQPRISWHSFRHTHATLLHANGEFLKTAQALLGHSDLETTLNVYTHTLSDSQRDAVERVAGVLFSDVLSSATAAVPRGRLN